MKESIAEYTNEAYESINSYAEKMKKFLKNSIIDTIEFNEKGSSIKLNREHFEIKMIFNQEDYTEVPYTVLLTGNYEKEEMKMVRKLLSYLPSDAKCYDIGANVGWYTLHIKKAYPNMKVYSFEPGPNMYERLCNNMQLNGFSSESCINVGMYKEEGKLKFYYDPNSSGASSMVNLRERETVHEILVDMLTMDKWTENNQDGGG